MYYRSEYLPEPLWRRPAVVCKDAQAVSRAGLTQLGAEKPLSAGGTQRGGSPWRKEKSQQPTPAPGRTYSDRRWAPPCCRSPSAGRDVLIFSLFQPIALKTAGNHLVACQGTTVLRNGEAFGVWSLATWVKRCAGLKWQVSAAQSLHGWSRRVSSFPAHLGWPGWESLPVLPVPRCCRGKRFLHFAPLFLCCWVEVALLISGSEDETGENKRS